MKLKAIFVFAAVLAICVGNSFATIGWAGLQWPPAGGSHLASESFDVYVQTWKGGCTDTEPGLTGQCADIDEVWFDYRTASNPTFTSVAMTWNSGHVSNNDEYSVNISSAWTVGGEDLICKVRLHDSSDDTWYEISEWNYVILAEGLAQDVEVFFSVDMGCTNPLLFAGGVFFVGSHTGWNMCQAGTEMYDDGLTGGDLVAGDGVWTGSWVFAAGSSPDYEYKFQRNDGNACVWGDMGNISLTVDDTNPTMVLPTASWVTNPYGPGEIAGPGSYCVFLDCVNELWVYLNTVYDPPTIANIDIVSGCHPDLTDCEDPHCAPGSGDFNWRIEQGGDMNYYLVMSVGGVDPLNGCFCITIDQILPVELAGFDAIAGDNEVTLTWTTASEVGNDYFSIVRDGTEMTRVNAHGTATGSEYTWVDNNVTNGVTYNYTLINVDVDGSRSELETASVTPNRNNANVMEYTLHQNYPNPFNPSTSIAYSLEEAGMVNITVFDITGREVATVVNGVMAAGSHSVEFDAAGLPSGIYMYRMEAGDFSAVQKMVLMK